MPIRRWLLLFYPRRSVGVPAAPVFSDAVAVFPVPDVSVTGVLLLSAFRVQPCSFRGCFVFTCSDFRSQVESCVQDLKSF